MLGKNSNEDKVFAECRHDVASMMAALTRKYARHSGVLALALCDSLAHFVSISARNPEKMLLNIGKRIADTDFDSLKGAMGTQIFGHSLGVIDGGKGAEVPLEHAEIPPNT